MSEGSKMGLFGSKDDKTESSSADTDAKPDSADRNAPYCIDSDSETYDTEALSIMDINDIIGVQTENAAESTLESEIAALTEIMTDSKGDTNSDPMNDIDGESADIKFTDELLTEFAALSPTENPIATTSKEDFDQDKSEDRSSKETSEVEVDVKIPDEAATKAEEPADENIGAKAEPESGNETKKESMESFDDAVEADDLLLKNDTVSTNTTSETETFPQVAGDLVEETSEAVKISSNDETIGGDKDLSKDGDDASVVSVEDAAKISSNPAEDVDSVLKTKSKKEEAADNPEDEKSVDLLTNVGSTSKSLQLIGEAYISEDSQEIDETDESPVIKVATVTLDSVKGQEIEEKENELEQKESPDNLSTNGMIDESETKATADITESGVQECILDNQDSTRLEDNKEADNTTKALLNLEDNNDSCRLDLNVELQTIVHFKDGHVMEEDESVDPSLRSDKNTDESKESDKATLIPIVNIVPSSSDTTKSTAMEGVFETKEEPLHKSEQLEDISTDVAAETSGMTAEDGVLELTKNGNTEELQEKMSGKVEMLHEAMDSSETDIETLRTNTKPVLETDNCATEDSGPLEESEASSSILPVCSTTELKNTTELDAGIHDKNTEVTQSVERPESIAEQDNAASVESNFEKELLDSQSNEESLTMQHSVAEDKFSEQDSESSVLPAEVCTNSEDDDNQCTTTTEFAGKMISTEEQSKEIPDSNEQLLETMQENTEEHIVDNAVTEKDTPLTKVEDEKIEDNEGSSIHKMIEGIKRAEAEKDSERRRLRIDNMTQSMSMEITSPIVDETSRDSSNDMPTKEDNLAVEDSKETRGEAENLEMELDQSASMSSVENNTPAGDFIEPNQREEMIEENSSTERDNSTETRTVELSETKLPENAIEREQDIGSPIGTTESETLGSIITENVPEPTIEDATEDIIPSSIELESVENVEANSNDDNFNEAETIEKAQEPEETREAQRVDSDTQVESKNSETDEEEVSRIEPSDKIQKLEENKLFNELSADTEENQGKDTFDKESTEIEGSKSTTEPGTDTICEKTATVGELKTTSEISTMQGPLESISHSESKPEQEKEEVKPKIQQIQHKEGGFEVLENEQGPEEQSESRRNKEEIQCADIMQPNSECSSGDVKMDNESEIVSCVIADEEQDCIKLQPENSVNKTDLQVVLDKSLHPVSCEEVIEDSGETESETKKNLAENSSKNTLDSEIVAQELLEIQIKPMGSKDDSKFSEKEEGLEKDTLLKTKPVDDKNLDDLFDIHTLENTLALSQTPSVGNEVENNSEKTVLSLINETAPLTLPADILLGSEVKIDEDLLCEPIEVLEKLVVVADEILIDELTNSVLKDTPEPLENISNLAILADSPLSAIVNSDELKIETLTNLSAEIEEQPVSLLGEVNKTCFIEDLNKTPSVSHDTNYITDVIISSTNTDNIQLTDNLPDMDDKNATADDFEEKNQREIVKTSENLIPEDIASIDQSASINTAPELEENLVLDKDIDIDLPLEQEEGKLIESVVLACDTKIDIPDEVLFDVENAEQNDVLCRTSVDNVDTSQQSSEFSELECAVKFLQESEEQTIDSPLLLSPKIVEDIVEENSEQSKSCLFLSETEGCQESLELPAELEEEITPDSIAISEAEIISEAAKLENERKLKIAAEMSKTSVDIEKSEEADKSPSGNNSEMLKSLLTSSEVPNWQEKSQENVASTSEACENTQIPKLSANIVRRSEKIPKISILEERLKEPPKIEIPGPEVSPKISDTPTTPKTSLLMQRDSRLDTKTMYQKMLESPKGGDRSEPRISDTPRKDSEKYEFENVGSPRIILKIAKSAIADCAEPRSPKSPKIRSAANSPNPEDSPGQKLGKIKLKLSKGGHPSIISNENFDETAQRHTEAILSPSHIGMKIKLSKSGDASIIQPEKHDSIDEIKESKHKFGEASPKRIESPLGMKIKLSKTGDPSIVQQESKDSTSKRKDKLDIGQEIPKRTDSPIGMKIKLSKSGDASIIQPEKQESSEDAAYRDKFEMATDIPKRTDSPIGMKIKLSKSGDASIISSENCEEFKDSPSKSRDKLSTNQDIPKRTDSPLGMKFKLSKSGGASIIQPEKSETPDDFREKSENISDITKRIESPIGMKIKLLKTGDASIIHPEKQESDDHRESIIIKHREKTETQEIQKRTDSPLGMRIKVTKSGEASVVPSEEFSENFDMTHEIPKRNESPIGMKIKLSKSGDASIIHPEKQEFHDESKDCRGSSSTPQEGSKSSESSLGMKIKLSKTGDASIIHPDNSPESKDSQFKRSEKLQSSGEGSKRTDSPLGMKIKLSKTGDASIIEPDKKEKPATKLKEKSANTQEVSQKRKEMEYPLEMKIKLSKTGHPTIIANEKQEAHAEMHSKSKDYSESGQSTHHKRTESMSPSKESQLRIFKTGHSTIIQSSRSEVTIEPIQMPAEQSESSLDISPKCKDMISQMELKKSKLEAKLSHILPEVTIQPVMSGEQKQIVLDKKSSSISRQQMSVINQEISITHVPPSKPADLSMSGKLKEILRKNATNSPANSDCEIIEHRPELIIVNENSNSSQDIMIIEEVKAIPQEVKVPRKRGRPKRSSLPPLIRPGIPQDPLALDNTQLPAAIEHRESDRPKRTCRNQKSYAPPKRGRGRGRGKRKMDRVDCAIGKIPRLEDPLTAIERSTMSLIAPLQQGILPESTAQTSELYKALKQGPMERKRLIAETVTQHGFSDPQKKLRLEPEPGKQLATDLALPTVSITDQHSLAKTSLDTSDSKAVMISEMLQLAEPVTVQQTNEKLLEVPKPEVQETKNIISDMNTTEHQNWLTPSIKLPETIGKTEAISMVQVMDEETRMSAESNSRSQTPARNISIPVVETVINEESQGSVLSTATTESEKVKVKNRRMEINFDPDEGPFTVDKIAEYEWPLDKKGDTFMLQEQISQYLGVKSFKRKYPDLKRRMVEMEERNYLRENCLVSEAMCDMGLTAICSTEVLDIMCSDFPDQYEEYRKHMREKQAKEHSKKQKELTAAANAERNRIDLAEMAVQSALSWNVNFNKARKESRKYSLDLQSFTIHVPKKQLKVDAERKASNYPVALIPGQYTDYYREYTPAELRYYPLNTVLYGPMRPNERKFDSQSEGSQSDSDSDSSSDDSSSSSSEGTQDTEESQSTVDEVDMEITAHKEDNKNLKCKMCLKHLNKHGKAEVLIQCGTCNGNVHPSCIDLTLDMVPHIQGYSWQCTDCKTCVQCHNPADEDKMLFCDMCDRGYHIYCVGLRRVPQGRWHCRECAVCASCGLRQPGGANSDRNSVAQWQHEYKKGERNTRVYVSTLCVPCSKLWRKGRYCPHCSRCHSAQRLDQEPNLVHCGACDKYLHLGCVEIRSGTLDRKNYICECCSTPSQLSRPSVSKNYKT